MRNTLFRSSALILAMLLLCACGTQSTPTGSTAQATEASTEATEPTVSQAGKEALDGKKILFIGNSYTHSAHAVIDKGTKMVSQEARVDTDGYFYQLCKRSGMDVTVTSWCFGGHNTTDTFGESCQASNICDGLNHASYFADPCFDYVAIQPYYEPLYSGDLAVHLQPIVDYFRQYNPDVKFLLMVPHMAYDRPFNWVRDVDGMAEQGFIVCNWGGMLHDICQKTVEVPGATQPYARPTFVVSVSAEDGHHQNILAGYLTALMAYCAITGDSAVGQPYDFCYDPSVCSKFMDLESYVAEKYTYDTYTNLIEVFRSEADMKGLQQLADQYLEKYNGVN